MFRVVHVAWEIYSAPNCKLGRRGVALQIGGVHRTGTHKNSRTLHNCVPAPYSHLCDLPAFVIPPKNVQPIGVTHFERY